MKRALLSGLLIAFSFPTVLSGWKLPNLGFLGWFGLVPLILALREARPKRAFCLGWVSSLVTFLIAYYWIYIALKVYGGLSVAASLATLFLLAGVMALYLGAACALAVWFARADGRAGERGETKGGLLLWLPIFWTLAEFARTYTPFGGFPWAHLALSQANYSLSIQIAEWTGFYGVLFVLVWFNVWLSESLKTFSIHKTVVTAALMFLVAGYGWFALGQTEKEIRAAPALKAGLIQPNIPQEEKWGFLPKHRLVFERAVAALREHVDLILWPETAFYETLWTSAQKIAPEKIGIPRAREEGKPFTLLGVSSVFLDGRKERYHNSAVLADADGRIWGKYHKVRLVPFGETIPFKKFLSFLTPVAAIGDFAAGTEAIPLNMGNVKLAPLICYEDIFPQASRAMVRRGAHFLVNLTNDAWYGFSSAAYQHLALAQFRAVETRRAMLRATNTGISAVIDPAGRLVNAAPWFEEGLIVHRIPLLARKTVYVRVGNWFIFGLLFLVVAKGICQWKKR